MREGLFTVQGLAAVAPVLLVGWIVAIVLLGAVDASLGGARTSKALRRWRLPLIIITLIVYCVPFALGAAIGFPLVKEGRIAVGAATFLLAPFAGLLLAVMLKKAVVGLLGGRTRHLGPPPA